MKKSSRFLLLLAVLLSIAQSVLASEPVNYYNSAIGKSDEALMTALRNIIRSHKEVSYSSGLLNAFAKADVDNEGYIIDIYSNCRYRPSDNGSSAKNVGEGYNREHSFPRSWFGGEVPPMNTDVFHVYPTDIRVNSQRGNYPYGVCANGTRLSYGNYVAKGKLGKSTYPGYYGTVFEPDDEYKGDLARTYFYMATCYKNELPTWPGSDQLNYAQNKYKAFSTWTINMLMEWTRLDPVSEKEIKRNEAVYGIQGNRNPFIDHPELAEYIWGDQQGKPWSKGSIPLNPAITAPANGTTIDLGSTIVGTPLSQSITIKGNDLTQSVSMSMLDNEYFYTSANSFTATEINNGTAVNITFTADEEGTFSDVITLSSDEVTTTFTIKATALPKGDQPPVQGDSIMEDWEGCSTGGYWTKVVNGHTWTWSITDAGFWTTDNLKHGELSCRLGKTSSSAIAMAQDVENGSSAFGFWAGSFGNDNDANLRVDYSNNGGASWTTLGSVTATKGSLQHFMLTADVEGAVRFRIVQTSGTRVNIDDITVYARASQPQPVPGDVNQDGEVGLADINAIIDVLLSEENDDDLLKRADVNGDNEVSIADINTLIDMILAS